MNSPVETPSRRTRRSRRQQLVSQDRWLVSYADFMTLLFAFFVVLFAVSHRNGVSLSRLSGAIHSGFSGRGNPAGPPAATPPDSVDLDLLDRQLRAALGESIQRHEVSLHQTPEGLDISFQELGFFHSGEANLVPGQAATIAKAGAILSQHNLTLRIEGHSDDQPIHNATFSSNWELSAARAMTVLLLLVDESHYDPTRLSMAGFGPYRPVASNATAEGRRKNRRVDIVVLRNP